MHASSPIAMKVPLRIQTGSRSRGAVAIVTIAAGTMMISAVSLQR